MIDPTVIPTPGSLPGGLVGNGPAPAAGAVETRAFASVLASGEAGFAAPATAVGAAVGTAPAAAPETVIPPSTRQDLAALPAGLLGSGKLLPDLVPPMPAAIAIAAEPAAPQVPAGVPVPVLPLLRAVRTLDAGKAVPARPEADEPAEGQADAPAADEPAIPQPVIAQGLFIAVVAQDPAANPAGDAAAAAPSAEPGAPPAGRGAAFLPQAIAAQVQGLPIPQPLAIRPASQARQSAPLPGEDRTLRLPSADPAAPTPQFTLAEPGTRVPAAAMHLRPVVEREAKAAPAASDASDGAALPAATDVAAGPAAPAPASTTSAPPVPGHSFAAVVDRLMAAREAARADGPAQAVAVNLHHAEFGEVSVRFEQRADGLAVALASPDPDFARAVQAATPSSGGNDAGLAGSFQRGTGGQPQHSAQTGAQPQPERTAAATRPERDETAATPAGRRGIFA